MDPTILKAMQEAKTSFVSQVDQLAQQPGGIQELERQMRNPDPQVRLQVAYGAAYARQDRSVVILTELVGDRDNNISGTAVRLLYVNWPPTALRSLGGARLKRNLIEFLQRDEENYRAALLLSGFKSSDTVAFLRGLRARQAAHRSSATEKFGHPVVFTDLALALMELPGGEEQLAATLGKSTPADRLALLDQFPFLFAQRRLDVLIPLLEDERASGRIRAKEETPFRICDLTIMQLRDAGLLPRDDFPGAGPFPPSAQAQAVKQLQSRLNDTTVIQR